MSRRCGNSRRGPRTTAVISLLFGALIATVLLAPTAAAATGTYVRLAQLAEDTAGWDLVVVPVDNAASGVTLPGPPVGELSDYVQVEPGDYAIGLRPPAGGGPPQVVGALTAVAGSAYTVIAIGNGAGRQLRVLTDDLTPPGPGQVRVRVIATASDEPVDVSLAGQILATGLRRGEASAYREVPAGGLTLGIGTSELPIDLRPHEIATVVILPAGGGLTAVVTVDAAAPPTVPPGAVDAGPGGAEHDLTGSAAMVGLAAAALGAIMVLRRRRDHESCRR